MPEIKADEITYRGRRMAEGHPALAQRHLDAYPWTLEHQPYDTARVDRMLTYLDRVIDLRPPKDVLVIGCGPRPELMKVLQDRGYHAVGAETYRLVTRLARDLDRYVHHRMGVNPNATLTKTSRDIRRQRHLLRRRQYQRAPGAKLFDLTRQMFDGVFCEYHARGHRFEDE